MLRFFAPLLLLGLSYLPDAAAGKKCYPIVGELYQNGVLKGSFEPIQGATSLTDFYGWSTARPYFSTGRLPVSPTKSLLFLYLDNHCQLSVGVVHSSYGAGYGSSTLEFTSYDFDVSIFANPTVKDDPEWFDIDEYVYDGIHRPATTTMSWVWNHHDADGMGQALPATLAGCFTVTPVSWNGINNWRFVGAAGETPLALTGTVEICINQIDHPRSVDDDLDGICNQGVVSDLCYGYDLCPNTPPGTVVDITGCPATGAEPPYPQPYYPTTPYPPPYHTPPYPPPYHTPPYPTKPPPHTTHPPPYPQPHPTPPYPHHPHPTPPHPHHPHYPTPPAPKPPSSGCPKCPISVFDYMPPGCTCN